MAKHQCRGLSERIQNHIDPEREEHLRWVKVEIENLVQRILQLTKSISSGSRERRVKKKTEVLTLAQDFHKHYESLYSLYGELRDEIKKNFVCRNGEDDDSSSSSDSDTEVVDPPLASNGGNNNNQGRRHSDAEETILKGVEEANMGLDPVKCLEGQVASLKLEVATLTTQKSELEEKLKSKMDEANEMKLKISNLGHQITEIQATAKDNESRFHELLEQSKAKEQQCLSRISELLAEGKVMQTDLNALKQQKTELEGQLSYEMKQRVSQVTTLMEQFDAVKSDKAELESELRKVLEDKSDCLIQMEALRNELKGVVEENECLKSKKSDLEGAITMLKEKNKQAKASLLQSQSNFQLLEGKMEEMAEEFRKQFEDQYIILTRRINVVEQLQVEYKKWHGKMKEAQEQDTKDLKQIAAAATDAMTPLDAVALKFETSTANFLNRISKSSCELKFAVHWAERRNQALEHAKEEINCLLSQLQDKEGEILSTREKLWKAENMVSELEKVIKEKEDGMLVLMEEKREAIRQLCIWVDYHRGRSGYYKKALSGKVNPGLKSPR